VLKKEKTRPNETKKHNWQIHKSIIRPSHETCRNFRYDISPSHLGVQGGVILIMVDPKSDGVEIEYHYTDIFVIKALELGLIRKNPDLSPKRKRDTLKTFYDNLFVGVSTDEILMPISFFVKAKSPEHLLALMGLHSRHDSTWMHNLTPILQAEFMEKDEISKNTTKLKSQKRLIANAILSLADGIIEGEFE
jgi:hypothetical protein